MEIITKYLKNTPTIGINELVNISNIPLSIFQYTLTSGTDIPQKNIDYVLNGRTYYVTRETALWLLTKVNASFKNIKQVNNAFDDLNNSITDNSKDMDKLIAITKHNLTNSLNYINDTLGIITAYENIDCLSTKKVSKEEKVVENIIPKEVSKPESKIDKLLPERTEEELNWTTKVCELLKNKSIKYNRHSNNILNDIYRKMTKDYGICFPQEKKDLKETFGIDKDVSIPTLRTITYNPTFRSIFEALLLDYDVENYISK